jgi:hypothetical protein
MRWLHIFIVKLPPPSVRLTPLFVVTMMSACSTYLEGAPGNIEGAARTGYPVGSKKFVDRYKKTRYHE